MTSEEKDPTGKDPHEPGAKLDEGKLMADLVLGDFAPALVEVIKVGTFGAKKYSAHGWLQVQNGLDRYSDAMLRHYLAEKQGERLDPQTSLLHSAHLAWNALARLVILLREERNENP